MQKRAEYGIFRKYVLLHMMSQWQIQKMLKDKTRGKKEETIIQN